MITSITLEKYKSFRESTTIDLKPLTILCGVNSSGKSSDTLFTIRFACTCRIGMNFYACTVNTKRICSDVNYIKFLHFFKNSLYRPIF